MKYGCVFCDWRGEFEQTIDSPLSHAACPLCGSEAQPIFENDSEVV